MIKTQATCHDCGEPFFLEDADWCNHYYAVGLGTKKCPNCQTCICHGETYGEIMARFRRNVGLGIFVETNNELTKKFGWKWQCVGNRSVEV